VIWEAFKPDSEPRRVGADEGGARGPGGRVRSDAEFMENTGGIY
jgi:penicillin-binding protein 1A